MFCRIIKFEDYQKYVFNKQGFKQYKSISCRFLINLILQSSERKLSQKLLECLSETYAVPLIISSYQSREAGKLKYPMLVRSCVGDGLGMFSFGVGSCAVQ